MYFVLRLIWLSSYRWVWGEGGGQVEEGVASDREMSWFRLGVSCALFVCATVLEHFLPLHTKST